MTVAVSLVLSLGLVRLLEGSLSAFSPARIYPIHAVWMVLTFVSHFFYWWLLWNFRGETVAWNFARFFFVALPAVVLYLQATLLVSSLPHEVGSWREHYYSIAALFFGLNLAYLLLVQSMPWIVAGEQRLAPLAWFSVSSLGAVAWVAAMLSRKPGVHLAVAIVAIGVNGVSILGILFVPLPD